MPPERDDDVAAGQQALLAAWHAQLAAGARRVGWKVGHAIPEAAGSVSGIVVGAITSATVLHDGAAYVGDPAGDLRAETELVAWFAADVDPHADPETVRGAVSAVGVALEIVDVARPAGGLRAIVAANAFHRAVVLGPSVEPPHGALGAPSLRIGAALHAADEPYPDIGAVALDVARLLAADGERLGAGDLLLTGSVVHRPVRPGDAVVARIEGVGAATAAIVA